ncbi:MAG: hypothetical protein Q8S13_05120, partial [Dehalococcoidia bacterium]|nr:hypothetical protein [Dehalococcoidia bacterium]
SEAATSLQTIARFPVSRALDPTFLSCVLPYLPEEVATEEARERVARVWRRRGDVQAFAPALACVAAISKAVYRDAQRAYEDSEELDRFHAVYVPFVDVFAGDVRVIEALRRKGEPGTWLPTRLVEAHDLDGIVRAVLGVGQHRFPPRQEAPPTAPQRQ